MMSGSTIVALSTPVGIGGIAVIRVSGPIALKVATIISKKPNSFFKDRYARYCPIFDKKNIEVDRGIITYFKAPNSYTGEDVIEISCHGGFIISDRIIEACLSAGCQAAEPGEFTKRAFINGKLDLIQAEAVVDIISSKTKLSQEVSYKILSGNFSKKINQMKKKLIDVLSLIEAELDFSEEEINITPNIHKIYMIDEVIHIGNQLIKTYSTGRLLKDGAIVCIAGEPNVGKSSLLNAILSENRVIVTDVPGTTRDAIEVFYQINGLPVRFVDTAGLRKPEGEIERYGIEFSREFISKSDLVIWVFDIQSSVKEIEKKISKPPFSSHFIPVLNKIDLLERIDNYPNFLEKKGVPLIKTSAKKEKGIKNLLMTIRDVLISKTDVSNSEVILTNARHRDAITKCINSLIDAKILLNKNREAELVSTCLREGLFELDKILGITTPDDIINNIFSRFCVGK